MFNAHDHRVRQSALAKAREDAKPYMRKAYEFLDEKRLKKASSKCTKPSESSERVERTFSGSLEGVEKTPSNSVEKIPSKCVEKIPSDNHDKIVYPNVSRHISDLERLCLLYDALQENFLNSLDVESYDASELYNGTKPNFAKYGVEVTGVTGSGKSTFTDFILKTHPNLKRHKPGHHGYWCHKDEPTAVSVVSQLNLIMAHLNVPGHIIERGATNNLLWRIILTTIEQYNRGEVVNPVRFVLEQFCYILPEFWALHRREPRIIFLPKDLKACSKRMERRNHGGDSWRHSFPMYIEVQRIAYGIFGMLTGSVFQDFASPKSVYDRLPEEYKQAFTVEAPPQEVFPKELVVPLPFENCLNEHGSIVGSTGMVKTETSCLTCQRH